MPVKTGIFSVGQIDRRAGVAEHSRDARGIALRRAADPRAGRAIGRTDRDVGRLVRPIVGDQAITAAFVDGAILVASLHRGDLAVGYGRSRVIPDIRGKTYGLAEDKVRRMAPLHDDLVHPGHRYDEICRMAHIRRALHDRLAVLRGVLDRKQQPFVMVDCRGFKHDVVGEVGAVRAQFRNQLRVTAVLRVISGERHGDAVLQPHLIAG